MSLISSKLLARIFNSISNRRCISCISSNSSNLDRWAATSLAEPLLDVYAQKMAKHCSGNETCGFSERRKDCWGGQQPWAAQQIAKIFYEKRGDITLETIIGRTSSLVGKVAISYANS